MISKILLTVLVIVGLVVYLRYTTARPQGRREVVDRLPVDKDPSPLPSPRLAVTILVAFMILVSGAALYLEWRDSRQLVTVHVVNTGTGERSSYQARRAEIEERSFVTVDGLKITPAEVERVEVEVSN